VYPDTKETGSGSLSGRPRRVRVVVVDDEPDTVLTLLELLREEGYDAHGFASGKEALRALQSLDPDVIVSDIAMPLVNGWDVAKEVREKMGERRPMLIALSGQYTKASDRMLAQIKGFNYYLTKPCDPGVLLALIKPLTTPK
jgi:CheY-like chemotaxis protein